MMHASVKRSRSFNALEHVCTHGSHSCRHVEKFHLSACLDRLKWSLAAFSNAESHLHRLAVNQVEVDV